MQTILPFLKNLKKNNNKDWFDKHKDEYLQAKEEFTLCVADILNGLKKTDKAMAEMDPKKSVFRIYRDVRFSKDKTPYKTHLGASMNPDGKKIETPGYYLHIEPGDCFLVGGIYMPESDVLNKIRQEIDYHLPEFKKILNAKDFKKYFGELDAEQKMKNPPRGFDKENPAMDFLKFKSYIVVHPFDEKDILKKDFAKKAADVLKAAYPMNQFLRKAIS